MTSVDHVCEINRRIRISHFWRPVEHSCYSSGAPRCSILENWKFHRVWILGSKVLHRSPKWLFDLGFVESIVFGTFDPPWSSVLEEQKDAILELEFSNFSAFFFNVTWKCWKNVWILTCFYSSCCNFDGDDLSCKILQNWSKNVNPTFLATSGALLWLPSTWGTTHKKLKYRISHINDILKYVLHRSPKCIFDFGFVNLG